MLCGNLNGKEIQKKKKYVDAVMALKNATSLKN